MQKTKEPVIEVKEPVVTVKEEKPEQQLEKAPKVKVVPGGPIDPIEISAQGGMVVKTEAQMKRVATYLLASKLVPKQFDTPEKILIAMQYCMSYGMDPVKGLRRVYVVNGVPSFWGETPLSMVMRGGNLFKIQELILDNNYAEICVKNKNLDALPFAAICRTWRRDEVKEAVEMRKIFSGSDKLAQTELAEVLSETMRETHFTVQDATKAGLWNAEGKLYKKYPKDMLKYRARGRNLLDNFANDVQGMNILEYHFPETLTQVNDYRDVTDHTFKGQLSSAESLNQELTEEGKQ